MIFRTESMLLLRNKFLAIPLIINVLFWGYIVVSYEIQDVHIQERATAFYSGFLWIMLFNLLIVGLFAVYMTNKDRESEFENLVVTYHVKNTEWITGKWLVTQLYGLCITLITLLIQVGWFLSGKMAGGDVFKNVFYVFVQMEAAFFLVISLGFLCGVLMKNAFSYILLPAILVLSLGLPFDYVGVAYSFDNPRFHLLTPFDYTFIESPYEGIWGINRVFWSSLLHQLVVFLVGIIVLFMALLLFRSKRRIQRERKMIPILMVVLIIPTLLFGSIRYTQYNEALEQFVTTAELYMKGYEGTGELEDYYEWQNSYYDAYLDYGKYDFAMERTDLTIQLQSNNQIDVISKLAVKYKGDDPIQEVKLTLYHGLQVTECTSDSMVTCTRDRDFLTVHFEEMIEPGEVMNIDLKYEGSILQYRDEGYIEQAFIGKNGVYLPKDAGWYPLIGGRQLIIARENEGNYFRFEQRNGGLIEDFSTEFTVNITNENQGIPLALTIPKIEAGVYQGTSQYGLSLVGGNLAETVVGDTRIVSHPEVQGAVKERVKKFQQGWSFVEEWLDIPITPSVIYILNDEHYYLAQYAHSKEFLVWSTIEFGNTEDSVVAYQIIDLLTKEYPTSEASSFDLIRIAMEWLIENNYQEKSNFRDWYISEWGPEETGLLDILGEYEEKGEKEFKDIVKFLFIHHSQLEKGEDFDWEVILKMYEEEARL